MASLAPSPLSGHYGSSPLNPTARAGGHHGGAPIRRNMFPTSRPLRPFAPAISTTPSVPGKKGIKLIVPKSDNSHMFVLDLTPDELARST
ncbi:hypothetical protein DACRYDRAFT_22824 [Dacryopinax primogenitus]|uniref:Uncharacterized protein n=1 Tax=Dacryopinax primogenitus (strain DJM 731) TaxID=1858805 RepID=M5FTL4_DACPD|nr:uncharacterized protein DACRYDRAFT_22824 [Dacryopinax primogenitus]EJU00991.1 hypothetical protein DACRYDRAFT_22824 [Dacryopinax primogenitus]